MIPKSHIMQWSHDHPWPEQDQVEQDLLLAQGMCLIASDSVLGNELVIRGGTAFHKLFLPKPLRYSEDLDFVRTTSGGIGTIMKRLTEIGSDIGFNVKTEMGKYPKVLWRYATSSGAKGRIKIEISTYERSPALPLDAREIEVSSLWFEGKSQIATFQPEELVATKLRALYQRSKGRDLFDLWLALTVLRLEPKAIVDAFPIYRPEGLTGELAEGNLKRKLEDYVFCHDCDLLVSGGIDSLGYSVQDAGELVIKELFSLY